MFNIDMLIVRLKYTNYVHTKDSRIVRQLVEFIQPYKEYVYAHFENEIKDRDIFDIKIWQIFGIDELLFSIKNDILLCAVVNSRSCRFKFSVPIQFCNVIKDEIVKKFNNVLEQEYLDYLDDQKLQWINNRATTILLPIINITNIR